MYNKINKHTFNYLSAYIYIYIYAPKCDPTPQRVTTAPESRVEVTAISDGHFFIQTASAFYRPCYRLGTFQTFVSGWSWVAGPQTGRKALGEKKSKDWQSIWIQLGLSEDFVVENTCQCVFVSFL